MEIRRLPPRPGIPPQIALQEIQEGGLYLSFSWGTAVALEQAEEGRASVVRHMGGVYYRLILKSTPERFGRSWREIREILADLRPA